MGNYYADAIKVLADDKTDFRALAYEIAKANPKALASAARRLELSCGWQRECLTLMQSGLKIEAIKACRAATSMSLADAKVAVEALV